MNTSVQPYRAQNIARKFYNGEIEAPKFDPSKENIVDYSDSINKGHASFIEGEIRDTIREDNDPRVDWDGRKGHVWGRDAKFEYEGTPESGKVLYERRYSRGSGDTEINITNEDKCVKLSLNDSPNRGVTGYIEVVDRANPEGSYKQELSQEWLMAQ